MARCGSALGDARDYGWMLINIVGGICSSWTGLMKRSPAGPRVEIFDSRDLLNEMAYAYTDLGTSYRILDRPRQVLGYLRAALSARRR